MKKLATALPLAVAAFVAGCAAAPQWQTDKSPDAEVAVVHRNLDPFASLLSVNGEGKGWGPITQVRLPPGTHLMAFVPNPLYWKLLPTDPNEPTGGLGSAPVHYIKFVAERGVTYDIRTSRSSQAVGKSPFSIDVVERSTGRIASTPIGNFYKQPVLKAQ